MKINFTLWRTSITGGVRVLFEVARGLAERGYEITITAIGGDHTWFSFPENVEINYVKTRRVAKLFFPLRLIVEKIKGKNKTKWNSCWV